VFAVGAMTACREAGIKIPDDMSITGCDDTDLGATQTPPLTSIHTPITEVGLAAAEQIIARLEGQPYKQSQSFPYKVVLRASVCKPAY
jgi:LacI family transcriptional regulator